MAFTNPDLEALRESILGAVITQVFGPSDVTLEPAYGGYAHFHQGLDIVLRDAAGQLGTTNAAVRTPFSGRVVVAGWDNGYGQAVRIVAPNGYSVLLGHLSSLISTAGRDGGHPTSGPLTTVGQLVRAGQIVGWQGSTGASTGNHVHVQIEGPNGPVDPGSGDVRTFFYNIYHWWGLGGGYNPDQFDYAPDPTHLSFQPVPNAPTPTIPPGADPVIGSPPTPTPGGGTVTPVGMGTGASGLLGIPTIKDLQSALAAGAVTIGLLFLAVVLVIGGVVSLSKEKPVQTVIQPVEQTAGAIKKAGTTASKAAAVAA